jgi:hypothetical protein
MWHYTIKQDRAQNPDNMQFPLHSGNKHDEFDVHVSVHLGDVHVQLNLQLDVLFVLLLLSISYFCTFRVLLHSSSGAPTVAYSHRCV